MENLKPLQEVAKNFEITDNQLRYWLKILDEDTIRKGKIRFLNPETESRIEEMARLINLGTPPKEAVVKVKGSPDNASLVPAKEENENSDLRKAILLLVEEVKAVRQENSAIHAGISNLVEENRSLRNDISSLQKALEYKTFTSDVKTVQEESPLNTQKKKVSRVDPCQIKTWQPEIRENPLQGKPWYEKAYIRIFKPEELRRHEN